MPIENFHKKIPMQSKKKFMKEKNAFQQPHE